MNRIPRHPLHVLGCLAGAIIALGVVLVVAVASAAYVAGLELQAFLMAQGRRSVGAVRTSPHHVAPAGRAEAAT